MKTKTIHQKGDHIRVRGKYSQCICSDSDTAVFAPLIKRNDCLSVTYRNMFAVPNNPKHDEFEFEKAKLIQWNGSSIKQITPINNSKGTEIDQDRTLKIKTSKGMLVFKKGQYLNYIDNTVSKP